MPGFNLADILEAVAKIDPSRPAQVVVGFGGAAKDRPARRRVFSWGELDSRASSLARFLVERGAGRQAKVAQYLYNAPEYLESAFACYKGSLVPVNTNYRYVESELLYLWHNADVEAVVFHGCFAERIAAVRDQLPAIHTWLWVDDSTGPCPAWATDYTSAVAGPCDLELPWERDGDDLWLLYTGGTTGMPKGVMWRQDDLFQIGNEARPEPYDLTAGLAGLRRQLEVGLGRESDLEASPPIVVRPVQMPACPLMHGTGYLTAQGALLAGGCVVTVENRRFDPTITLDAIEQEGVQSLAIVGDAFARPLVQVLDAEPDRWDISSLVAMVSSGVMWSEEVKQGLLRHHPRLILTDSLGSSESIGMARTESTSNQSGATARFTLGDHACLLDEQGAKVEPGSGVVGRIAVSGRIPQGYYKDPEKTAQTFPVLDGVRYSVAGDYATLEADGALQLLGRGSVCINTGGEKVFPEEVEEALKSHVAVRDAVVVGVPDIRFGQAITGVVVLQDQQMVEGEELIAWVKQSLAPYKAPRKLLFRPSVERAANGKADYNGLKQWAIEQLGLAVAEGRDR